MRVSYDQFKKRAPLHLFLILFACSLWSLKGAPGILTIRTQPPTNVVISWPDDGMFVLQTSGDLARTNWNDSAYPVVSAGGTNNVTIQIQAGLQYFRLRSAGSGGFAGPQSIPGLAYYWNFHDLAVSNLVNTWTDRVSGIALKNAGVAPTNTAMGVRFATNPTPLTNASLSLGSNFTLWLVCRPDLIDTNRRTIFGSYSSGRADGLVISNGLLYGSWSATDFPSSAQLNHPYPGDINETFDIVDAEGVLYINGTRATIGVGQPTNTFPFRGLGNSSSTNSLAGFVQYVGVWTNYQFTPADVAALDAWVNTNGVTNVVAGLLAHYRLDEGFGTSTADSSGNGHSGTLLGTPAWTDGLVSNALSFSGNGQVIDAGDFADNLPAFSTSFWIKGLDFWSGTIAQATTGASMLDKASAGLDGQGWGVFADAPFDMKGYVADTNGNWYESPPIQVDGGYWAARWHHVVCNYFYTMPLVNIYLDGVLCRGENGPAESHGGVINSIANTGHLFIGGNNIAQDASCQLDDVRVYSRPLSDQEIAILYRWRGQP